MKRLLQWLGLWSPDKSVPPATDLHTNLQRANRLQNPKRADRRAANNAIYFGNTDAARPTWGDADPLMSDAIITPSDDNAFQGPDRITHMIDEIGIIPTFENYGGIPEDTFQGFGGGESDGAGTSGSWDDGGSSSDGTLDSE